MDDLTRRRWERLLVELRLEADEAWGRWRHAGGYWPPGEAPSQPDLFAVARAAQERYYAAAAECYPKKLDDWLRRLREHDRTAIEEVIQWLEADYFTRWTGYIKQKLLFQLCQAALTDEDRERLRAVVLRVCARGRRQEFREVRRLARRQLATADFAAELRSLATSTDRQTTREAAHRIADAVESVL